MVSKDTVIGIVGAVILVAAMVGVFWYEGTQGADTMGNTAFDVTWATESENGPTVSGDTAEGDATAETLAIDRGNLTDATFTLVWADDVGSPDTFRLTVVSPDGSVTNTTEGASGTLKISFPGLNAVPEGRTVFADSADDARGSLASQYTKAFGTGDWSVTVELVEAGDFSPIDGGPPVQEDDGNAWELKSTLSYYTPTLKKQS